MRLHAEACLTGKKTHKTKLKKANSEKSWVWTHLQWTSVDPQEKRMDIWSCSSCCCMVTLDWDQNGAEKQRHGGGGPWGLWMAGPMEVYLLRLLKLPHVLDLDFFCARLKNNLQKRSCLNTTLKCRLKLLGGLFLSYPLINVGKKNKQN